MKEYSIILATIWATLLWSGLLKGETRVYKERARDQVTIHRFVIEESALGFSIDLVSEKGYEQVKQKYDVDSSLATLSWEYEYPGEETRVRARREGNKILLKGINKGKTIEKTFKINNMPWNQTFNIGLERFALSPAKELRFWSIGTMGPGRMKITKFAAKKKAEENINLDGQPLTAIHIQMSMTGLLSVFWKGHYWYRKSDGVFIRYQGKGSGSPFTIMELVSEEELGSFLF